MQDLEGQQRQLMTPVGIPRTLISDGFRLLKLKKKEIYLHMGPHGPPGVYLIHTFPSIKINLFHQINAGRNGAICVIMLPIHGLTFWAMFVDCLPPKILISLER